MLRRLRRISLSPTRVVQLGQERHAMEPRQFGQHAADQIGRPANAGQKNRMDLRLPDDRLRMSAKASFRSRTSRLLTLASHSWVCWRW